MVGRAHPSRNATSITASSSSRTLKASCRWPRSSMGMTCMQSRFYQGYCCKAMGACLALRCKGLQPGTQAHDASCALACIADLEEAVVEVQADHPAARIHQADLAKVAWPPHLVLDVPIGPGDQLPCSRPALTLSWSSHSLKYAHCTGTDLSLCHIPAHRTCSALWKGTAGPCALPAPAHSTRPQCCM